MLAPLVRRWWRDERGAALVEVALVLPLLLFLAFGVVGAGRVVQGQLGVSAVAREVARSAALAETAGEARARGLAAGHAVAEGYGLTNGSLALGLDVGAVERGGQVRAVARYRVSLGELPLLGWAALPVSSEHAERIDLYRSRWGRETDHDPCRALGDEGAAALRGG